MLRCVFQRHRPTPFIPQLGTVQLERVPFDARDDQQWADRPEKHSFSAAAQSAQPDTFYLLDR